MYSIVNCQATYTAAMQLARGVYQRAILSGNEAISGATLRGRAKLYSGRYRASSRALLARCRKAGLAVQTAVGPHGKIQVVIG